jgi:hypothetical protein
VVCLPVDEQESRHHASRVVVSELQLALVVLRLLVRMHLGHLLVGGQTLVDELQEGLHSTVASVVRGLCDAVLE